MSIRKHKYKGEESWWAHCDICDENELGEALGPAHSFTELKDLMSAEGWHSYKDIDGVWRHFCPECRNDVYGGLREGR